MWRLIETAPKDGTRFLAWFPFTRGIAIIHRHDPGGEAQNPKHHYECWAGDDLYPCMTGNQPTLWQALPQPPVNT